MTGDDVAESMATDIESGTARCDPGALSTVRLSDFGLRREPPRPAGDRQRSYERMFDFDTLFYDVFRATDPGTVYCLGPPLLNCENEVLQAAFQLPDSEAILPRIYRPPRSHLQPSCQIRLHDPSLAAADRILMTLGARQIEIPIRPSGTRRFGGRRVIVTVSKDNPLEWIEDWAAFHARVHGADAVLLYDNGSSRYDIQEIRSRLETVRELSAIVVVPWRFPYGPGVGPRNVQDSFFCQPGALEHARWRHCGAARGVLNSDIDELVVSGRGRSIFEAAESSERAVMTFPGVWLDAVAREPAAAASALRHSDCLHRDRRQKLGRTRRRSSPLLRTKWIAVPSRCTDDVDWGVHDVYPGRRSALERENYWKSRTVEFVYRHFRPITTGWKKSRGTAGEGSRSYSRRVHAYDWELSRAFALAFPGRFLRAPFGFVDGGFRGLISRVRELLHPFRKTVR